MKKAKCIKGFRLEKCDDNGFMIEGEYFTIDDNSIWSISEDKYRFCAGPDSIRLENEEGKWLEFYEEDFKKYFKIIESEEK